MFYGTQTVAADALRDYRVKVTYAWNLKNVTTY